MLSIVICIIRSLTPVAVLSALGHLKGLLEGHAVVCIDRWHGCEEDRLLFLGYHGWLGSGENGKKWEAVGRDWIPPSP